MISDIEKRTMRKVTLRLIPFMVLLYIVSYLDRVNVGFAALTMNKALGFSSYIYGWGAGIFFFGYFLFEVPSNLMLERFGARRWIARIMITWGIIAVAMAAVSGTASFLGLRFLLGLAEAGLFPGMILYITYWFPKAYRGRTTAAFMCALPLCTVIGAPISGLLLALDGWYGMAGWKWLFILEGIPAILLGFVVLKYLKDKPADASWLSTEEKTWLVKAMDEDRASNVVSIHTGLRAAMTPQVLHFSFIHFCLLIGLYGIGLWLPQIVKEFGVTNIQVGFLTAIPYIPAVFLMLFWGRRGDQTGERKKAIWLPAFVGGASLVASAYSGNPVLQMILISAAAVGLFSALGSFWPLPTSMLSSTAAAGGIGIIGAIGNLGGFAGPFAVGWIRDSTHNFQLGMVAIGAAIFTAGILVILLGTRRTATPLTAPQP